MDDTADRRKREAFAELTYSNMLMLNALVQVLTEKGVLTAEEIVAKVKALEVPHGTAAGESEPANPRSE
jgi:hypothetical protein